MDMDQYFDDFDQFLLDNPEHRKSYELFQHIADESPRGMVLVIAAELDRMLLSAIKELLHDGAGLKELDRDNQGPISTFSARINLAHSLGIIDDTEHRDLHLIRKVRNDFAHSVSANLTDQSISARIRELSDADATAEADENLEKAAVFLLMQLAGAIDGAREANLPVITRTYGPPAD
ncbi:MltR family transcriptional regulator [Labrenzia sp. ac12]